MFQIFITVISFKFVRLLGLPKHTTLSNVIIIHTDAFSVIEILSCQQCDWDSAAHDFLFISHITDNISTFTAKSPINEPKLILKWY